MTEEVIEGDQNHEIVGYVSVRDRIEHMDPSPWSKDNIPVKMRTSLSNALTKLSNSPATFFTATHYDYWNLMPLADISLTISGEDAGTFGNPNVEKIVEKSKPSPFGKGDKTVMDLEYRNGREVVAADIVIGSGAQPDAKKGFYKLIETHISESLFVDKLATIKLYKLAVYGKGGHFDWHRDTTHGDNHHATVLVALNTEWKGGILGLRHEGETVDVDMHAESVERSSGKDKDEKDEDDESSEKDEDESGDGGNFKKSENDENQGGDGNKSKKYVGEKVSSLGFQIVAFYTDIEHKVENITDGTRIVLQFDVNVEGNEDDFESDEDYDDDEDDLLQRGSGQRVSNNMKPLFPFSGPDASRDVILEKLIAMVKDLQTSKSIDEVVFPLRHLYRLASIKPEYLKGVDAYMYKGLKKMFEVDLKPIVLVHQTDGEGSWLGGNSNIAGFPFVSERDKGAKRPKKMRKIEKKSEIHVPARYELLMISSTGYVEHTGNEAQVGEGRYFGGGMFVAAK
jgi:hypothetical protein